MTDIALPSKVISLCVLVQLKKFQARNSPQTKKGGGGSNVLKSTERVHTPNSYLTGVSVCVCVC